MSADCSGTGGLEDTARWTAGVRALESARPDRLFDDPWAAALAGAAGMAWVEQRGSDAVLPIVIRTRYFDDWVRSAAGAGIAQVVLIAAGLDTRAYRLGWPDGTTVFELDRPAVLRQKASVLGRSAALPGCRRVPVAADLTEGWPGRLVAAGFDAARAAAWLAEGCLFYLDVPVIGRILDGVTGLAAPASRLAFDIVNSAVLTSPWTRAWVDMQAAAGAPWVGTMDDPAAFLSARGWSATLAQPGDPGADHGRWKLPDPPADRPDLPHNWYVTAERLG